MKPALLSRHTRSTVNSSGRQPACTLYSKIFYVRHRPHLQACMPGSSVQAVAPYLLRFQHVRSAVPLPQGEMRLEARDAARGVLGEVRAVRERLHQGRLMLHARAISSLGPGSPGLIVLW